MNLEELKKIIFQVESERLEFKRSTDQRTEVAKTVCALLNGSGGLELTSVPLSAMHTSKLLPTPQSAISLKDRILELLKNKNLLKQKSPNYLTIKIFQEHLTGL